MAPGTEFAAVLVALVIITALLGGVAAAISLLADPRFRRRRTAPDTGYQPPDPYAEPPPDPWLRADPPSTLSPWPGGPSSGMSSDRPNQPKAATPVTFPERRQRRRPRPEPPRSEPPG